MYACMPGARSGSAASAIRAWTRRTRSDASSGIVRTVATLRDSTSSTSEREPMTEPARYVHIVDDVPELDDFEQGPVLIHSLDGFLDAGNAAAIATQALLSQSSGRVVASFEIDAFYDYRAR